MRSVTRELALSIVMVALGVALSPFYFPAGPARCYPFQHMVNVVSGIFLGPWVAAVIALVIGAIRNGIGTGTVFAFPGGIPGAFIVGLVYRYLKKSDYAAFTEPVGTTIGALISALLIAPFIGSTMPPIFGIGVQWALFVVYFLISSVPGCIIGFFVVKALRRTGIAGALLPGKPSR